MSKAAGGLGLIDLWRRQDALKISWTYILEGDVKMKHLFHQLCSPYLKDDLWRTNFCSSDVERIVSPQRHPFWFDVLQAWSKVNYKDEADSGQSIWLNSNIKVNGKIIFWKDAYKSFVCFIGNIRKTRNIRHMAAFGTFFGNLWRAF